MQRQEFGAARRTLEGVVNADSTAVGPRILLSHALIQEGRDWQAAENVLQDVLKLQPNNQEAHHNLKVLHRQKASGL